MEGGRSPTIDDVTMHTDGGDAAADIDVQRSSNKSSRSSTSTSSNHWTDFMSGTSNLLTSAVGKLKNSKPVAAAAPTTSDKPVLQGDEPPPNLITQTSEPWTSEVKERTSENKKLQELLLRSTSVNKQVQESLLRSTNVNEQLQQSLRRSKTENEQLKQSLLRSTTENEELRRKLEVAETRNAKQSSYSDGTGGGSYDESGPSPPHLQKAVESVVFDLGQCSAAILRFIRSSSLHTGIIRISDFGLPGINLDLLCSSPINNSSHHGFTSQLVTCKLALSALLCSVFFFSPSQSGCSSWTPPSPPIFRRPDQLRRELFQIYRLCKSEDILLKLLVNDLWDDIVKSLCAHPAGASVPPPLPDLSAIHIIPDALKPILHDLLRFLLQSTQLLGLTYGGELLWGSTRLLGNKDFKTSFVRLARSAWLLHKLAFSFKPTVEMIVVPPGSPFDKDFMKDTTPIEDEDEDELEDTYDDDHARGSGDHYGDSARARARDGHEGGERSRVVALMSVPGFSVRGNVIKAQVICVTPVALS